MVQFEKCGLTGSPVFWDRIKMDVKIFNLIEKNYVYRALAKT